MQNVGRAAMRSLQRVVHRLRGYVSNLSDAYGCRQSQNCLCVVCWLVCVWLAKIRERNEGVVSCKSRPLREGLRSLVRKHNRITSLMCT